MEVILVEQTIFHFLFYKIVLLLSMLLVPLVSMLLNPKGVSWVIYGIKSHYLSLCCHIDLIIALEHNKAKCGLNVHNLLHLPNYVVHWGPLWGWSCFDFEGSNGKIIKRFHGTKDGCYQVNIIKLLLLLFYFHFLC